MLIGLVAPPWVSVPPRTYGGTETVVDNLARGLTALGHDVRLFTIGDSRCPVRRSWLYHDAPVEMGNSVDEAAHVLAAYSDLDAAREHDGVDIVHDHTTLGPLLQAARSHVSTIPVVTTHHGPFDHRNRRIFGEVARHAAVVAISYDQARRALGVPISAVIHHGIDLEAFRQGTGSGGYLLFLGRMSPVKGVHRALSVAHKAGMPLRIATKMRESGEYEYYRHVVRPLLSAGDEMIVEPDREVRGELLEDAVALINPIGWPEPFGLVMAEALACGTPVLAFPCGAAPEIVDHGRTGLLCADEAQMVAGVDRIGDFDRGACRDAIRERFSLQRMSRDYEGLYERLIAAAQRRRRMSAARPRPLTPTAAWPRGLEAASGGRGGS